MSEHFIKINPHSNSEVRTVMSTSTKVETEVASFLAAPHCRWLAWPSSRLAPEMCSEPLRPAVSWFPGVRGLDPG